mmetsp:Transcript_39912/g.126936  ORF Transcript_39912/g.126936 Transcript_39912/m.126936 type:complete len:234 (+) Transcript_39912:655-1356(+)
MRTSALTASNIVSCRVRSLSLHWNITQPQQIWTTRSGRRCATSRSASCASSRRRSHRELSSSWSQQCTGSHVTRHFWEQGRTQQSPPTPSSWGSSPRHAPTGRRPWTRPSATSPRSTAGSSRQTRGAASARRSRRASRTCTLTSPSVAATPTLSKTRRTSPATLRSTRSRACAISQYSIGPTPAGRSTGVPAATCVRGSATVSTGPRPSTLESAEAARALRHAQLAHGALALL